MRSPHTATRESLHAATKTQHSQKINNNFKKKKKRKVRDFPGCPVVKNSPSNTRGAGSVPSWKVEIPHALWPKCQDIEEKQYCNKFNKDFKNDLHPKKNLKK